MTAAELGAIRARYNQKLHFAKEEGIRRTVQTERGWQTMDDIAALLAEVDRLQEVVDELRQPEDLRTMTEMTERTHTCTGPFILRRPIKEFGEDPAYLDALARDCERIASCPACRAVMDTQPQERLLALANVVADLTVRVERLELLWRQTSVLGIERILPPLDKPSE